jgi:hypothetical protein
MVYNWLKVWHGAAQLQISSNYKAGIEQQTADSGTLTAVFPVQFVVQTMREGPASRRSHQNGSPANYIGLAFVKRFSQTKSAD